MSIVNHDVTKIIPGLAAFENYDQNCNHFNIRYFEIH